MTRFTLRGEPPPLRNPAFLATTGESPQASAPGPPPAIAPVPLPRPQPRAETAAPPPRRLAAPWPAHADPHSTESRLAAIGFGAGADFEEWARELCERVDRRGQRNAAVRAAAALLRQDNPSATAKTVESELRGYLSRAWPRERDFASPEPGCSALRQALWRVGKLTAGAGLGWRTILDLIEN